MSYYHSFDVRSVEEKHIIIAGLEIKEGDLLTIKVGKDNIYCEFRGFNKHLYVFHVKRVDTGEDLLIPYKYIKMISKYNSKPAEGEDK